MEDKRLHQLFDQWIDQRLSDEEESELMTFLSQASSEPQRQALAAALYEQCSTGSELESANAERIIREILHPEAEVLTVSGKRRWIAPVIGRAAAILGGVLVIGAVVFFSLRKKDVPAEPVIAGKYITAPVDHNQAVLVLEDGRQIDLAGHPVSNIRQGQTAVIHTDSAALLYTATATAQPAGTNTLIVPRGAKYKVTLADGSEIWLNAESQLRYPAHFGGLSKREVYLERGEAYFRIKKDAARPFIVNVRGMDIDVLGTEFNVDTYTKNYTTTLVQGAVRLTTGATAATLEPGQQGVLSEGRFTRQSVEPELYTAWINNQVLCVETPLEEVMEKLGRQYDYTVQYSSPQLKELQFGGRLFITEHIEDVLAIIEQTAYVKFRLKGKIILVSQESSN